MEKPVLTDRRENCFNFIRILAAIQVFLGHGITHFELNIAKPIDFFLSILQGVPIFFILSGFLIWNSLENAPNFKIYAKKRILRLYPELWGGVIVNMIVMIILYRENIKFIPFIVFQFTQSTFLQFWTPNSLRGYGCSCPNGSLWTICVMVQSYIVIYFMKKFLNNKKEKWILTLGIFTIFNIITPYFAKFLPTILYKLFCQTFIPYLWLFLLGGMVCEYFDSLIYYLKKYWSVFILISAFFSYLKIDMGIYGTIKSLFLGLAIIGFAYRFPNIKIKKDFSYGLYIYHMIIINAMLHLGLIGSVKYLIIAFMISFILAIISYNTLGQIGKKLKLKLNKEKMI